MSVTLLISYILGTLAATAIVYIAFLTFKHVINKVRAKSEVMNEDEVGYIIKNELENGQVKVIHGVLNRKTNKTRESEAIVANEIDLDLKNQERFVIID